MTVGEAVQESETVVSRLSARESLLFRAFAWTVVALTFVFLTNNFLNFGLNWPGVLFLFEGQGFNLLSSLQLLSYLLSPALCVFLVAQFPDRSLRQDNEAMTDVVRFIIRASFWAVLLVGVADMIISFLRVEGILSDLIGDELTKDLGRPHFRGPYIHMPLLAIGIILAYFTRTLGFTWLALLVVLAELQIVVSRFVFSYEQAFMGDLVRFWYAALFLFASAHTLTKEGHVRVDVFYTMFSPKTKGLINAVGSLLLGISLCWVILFMGMWDKTNVINSALFNFEVSQSGFGMYVKYLMAGFLGIFAVSMMIQFSGYMLEGLADYRGEPGKQQPASPGGH